MRSARRRAQVSLSLGCVLAIGGCAESSAPPSAKLESQHVSTASANSFGGIQIDGSVRFIGQVKRALSLPQQRSPPEFAIVQQYVKRIQESPRSGMWAQRNPPTYEMSQKTAMYSVTWCAGSIAHDSYHSMLYHTYRQSKGEAVPDSAWTGQLREKECIAHQLRVMRKIAAPSHEITHLCSMDGSHFDVNRDGRYTWDDYARRDW